jgi:CheY-like chemotaxis protein
MTNDDFEAGSMQKDQDYSSLMAEHFKNLNLELSLCSPKSLNLTEAELLQILTQVQLRLPDHLKGLPQLNITLQASAEEHLSFRSASIQIFTPFSPTPMAVYKAKISNWEITLDCLSERPVEEIRKLSLGSESEGDTLLEPSADPVIIIVDDDVLIRMILASWIGKICKNPTIRRFVDAKHAVEYYKTGQPCHLFFMDFQMPGLGGEDATKMIRTFEIENHLKPVPIIGMTALALDGIEWQVCGMNVVCNKPLRMEVISAAFHRFFGSNIKPLPQPKVPQPKHLPDDTADNEADETPGIPPNANFPTH